jgi:transposase
MNKYPDWVMVCKKPNTEIKKKDGRFYLYEVGSIWNSDKKRAQKISGQYLGRITESGLVCKHRNYVKKPALAEIMNGKISVKEFGASSIFYHIISSNIFTSLQEIFPEYSKEILVISIMRTIYQCPMKNVESLYLDSYLSNIFGDLKLSGKDISNMMQIIGRGRENIVKFMQKFIVGSKHLIFDMSDVISASKNIGINSLGKCGSGYDTKINLLYMFSIDKKSPIYYRILPGNISDASSFVISLEESGAKDFLIVADKGFTSKKNIDAIKSLKARFIMPLKRDSKLINYNKLIEGDAKNLDGHFIHEKRAIWHYSYDLAEEGFRIFIFIDEKLRYEERNDYLTRLSAGHENYSHADFLNKQFRFGTISIAMPIYYELKIIQTQEESGIDAALDLNAKIEAQENMIIIWKDKENYKCKIFLEQEFIIPQSELKQIQELLAKRDLTLAEQNTILSIPSINRAHMSAKSVYLGYKERMQVEMVFDNFKNLLEADRTYASSEAGIEAWMFFNHIAMMMIYDLYRNLHSNDLISKYSLKDIIQRLNQIRTIKIHEKWICSEINNKTLEIINKLYPGILPIWKS